MGITDIILNMPRKVVQEYSTPMMFCTVPTVPPAAPAPPHTHFHTQIVQACTSMRMHHKKWSKPMQDLDRAGMPWPGRAEGEQGKASRNKV